MTQRIMELARMLGQTAEPEEELLATLCTAAQAELASGLRDGIGPGDCPEAFALAGAWLALAGLEVSREAGLTDSFRAGDVTVQRGDGARKARLLREQAKRLMSAWTKDRRFLFYGV